MNMYKYNKIRNQAVFKGWLIICLVLTASYMLEIIKGNLSIYYVLEFLMFTWMPLAINYSVSLVFGRGNINIKYGVVLGYMLFYIYAVATAHTNAVYVYIFPMMFVLLMYDDVKLMDLTSGIALIVNVVSVIYRCTTSEEVVSRFKITEYEIEIAALALSSIFLRLASNVLAYGNRKLVKLNDVVEKDELTSVYNRHFLTTFINEKFRKSLDKEITLGVVDIDDFKRLNDNYGHKFGDLVLRRIATILVNNSKKYSDTYIVRIGGDEFIVISSEITKQDMVDICKRVCEEIVRDKLRYGEEEVEYTVSIGVASSVDSGCDTYNTLYDTADKMLYTVKNNGKSAVAINEK